MARRQTATQAAIVRALKGAQAAGIKVARFEINGETIVIHSGEQAAAGKSALEAWETRRGSR